MKFENNKRRALVLLSSILLIVIIVAPYMILNPVGVFFSLFSPSHLLSIDASLARSTAFAQQQQLQQQRQVKPFLSNDKSNGVTNDSTQLNDPAITLGKPFFIENIRVTSERPIDQNHTRISMAGNGTLLLPIASNKKSSSAAIASDTAGSASLSAVKTIDKGSARLLLQRDGYNFATGKIVVKTAAPTTNTLNATNSSSVIGGRAPENATITFYELVRQNGTTTTTSGTTSSNVSSSSGYSIGSGSGVAFFKTNSTGQLAVLNNLVGAFQRQSGPAFYTIKIWNWSSGVINNIINNDRISAASNETTASSSSLLTGDSQSQSSNQGSSGSSTESQGNGGENNISPSSPSSRQQEQGKSGSITSQQKQQRQLGILISVAKNPISAGTTQTITISVSDAITHAKIKGASVRGTVTDDSGRTQQTLVGTTSKNGQISHSWTLGRNSNPGTFHLSVQVSANGYDTVQKMDSFKVVSSSPQKPPKASTSR